MKETKHITHFEIYFYIKWHVYEKNDQKIVVKSELS